MTETVTSPWTGMLAPLGVPDQHGRILCVPDTVRHADLPLPIYRARRPEEQTDEVYGLIVCGYVELVKLGVIENRTELWASGTLVTPAGDPLQARLREDDGIPCGIFVSLVGASLRWEFDGGTPSAEAEGWVLMNLFLYEGEQKPSFEGTRIKLTPQAPRG